MLGKFGRFFYTLRILMPSFAFVLWHASGWLQLAAAVAISAGLLGWYLRHRAIANQQPISLQVTKVSPTARSMYQSFFALCLPIAIDLLKSEKDLPDPLAALALVLVLVVFIGSGDLPLDPVDYLMRLTHYDVSFANAADSAKTVTVVSRSRIQPRDTVNLVYITDNIAFNVNR